MESNYCKYFNSMQCISSLYFYHTLKMETHPGKIFRWYELYGTNSFLLSEQKNCSRGRKIKIKTNKEFGLYTVLKIKLDRVSQYYYDRNIEANFYKQIRHVVSPKESFIWDTTWPIFLASNFAWVALSSFIFTSVLTLLIFFFV